MHLIEPMLLDIFEGTFALFLLETGNFNVGKFTALSLCLELMEVLGKLLDRLVVLNVDDITVTVINKEHLHLALSHSLHNTCTVPLVVSLELGGAERVFHYWLMQVLGSWRVKFGHKLVNLIVLGSLIEHTHEEGSSINSMCHLHSDLIEEWVSLPRGGRTTIRHESEGLRKDTVFLFTWNLLHVFKLCHVRGQSFLIAHDKDASMTLF